MNKLLILSVILSHYCLDVCTAEVIPVAVQSTRSFDVETVNLDEGAEPYSPHVFEVEPSSSPLRIVFSSESSPLSVEAEREVAKLFQETPIQASAGVDAKQDRRGEIAPDSGPINGADAGPINEDEYEIIDQYQRYVPVKVRDNTEQVMGGSHDDVVVIKPAKAKTVTKQKAKKVIKVPVAKSSVAKVDKTTTVKVSAKVVVATTKATTTAKPATTRKPTTPPAEVMTEPSTGDDQTTTAKFGARLARHTKQDKKSAKKSANKKSSKKTQN